MTEPIASVRNLKKYYDENDRTLLDRVLRTESPPVRAVDGVSFSIEEGETVGLVGESGCGKSTVGQVIVGLKEPTSGTVAFRGKTVSEMDAEERRAFKRDVQIIFQDPFSSLNPRMTVGDIVQEPLNVHGIGTKAERRERAIAFLERVGLSVEQFDRYPHEFSGGQRQRIGIARALVLKPDFVVLDEPVSSLDVSVQAQILNLLSDLQEELGLTYLFIAHDLGVVKYICDRIAVMYLGTVAEIGATDDIFADPRHPYTRGLLESIPRINLDASERDTAPLFGDVPSPREPPSGCRFHTRCPAIVPPEAYELRQDVWRSITDLRLAIESESATLAAYSVAEDGDERRDRETDASGEIRSEFDIPSRIEDDDVDEIVSTAIEHVVRGDFAAAERVFESELATVCTRDTPEPVAVDDGHEAACFLVGRDERE